MLIRKWILLGSIALLTTIVGCNREQVAPVAEEPEPPVAEAPADPEDPALDTGDDASFGVPTELPETAPAPGDPWWAEAVASCYAAARGYEVERQRPAPNALLAFGRDAAREALEAIIADPEPRMDDELHFTHRFMAAWCLANEHLDYTRGREIVLRYLDALAPEGYTDPEIERKLTADENHVSAAVELYEDRRDPAVLHKLMQVAKWSDGAMSEVLMGAYVQFLHDDTKEFLGVMSQVGHDDLERVCALTAGAIVQRGVKPDPRWLDIESRLDIIARDREHALRDTARNALVHLKLGMP